MNRLDRIRGCLLGGGVGDALGAAVEFFEWPQIEACYGSTGIVDLAPAYGRIGAISDDTQMMLFTADGLLRAFVRNSSQGNSQVLDRVHASLLRWLMTQDFSPAVDVSRDGWLFKMQELWDGRRPDATCLAALRASKALGVVAENQSRGCAAVTRSAPFAFFGNAFDQAREAAHLTHGHTSSGLAAGLFADILQRMVDLPVGLEHALAMSLAEYGARPGMQDLCRLLERVLFFSRQDYPPTPKRIADLGAGWIAEEALAIGVWCTLTAPSFEEGLIRAVNHGGDSGSTGMIAGHLLGVQHGVAAIPARWLASLELRDAIERMADDIERVPRAYCGIGGLFDGEIERAYPV